MHCSFLIAIAEQFYKLIFNTQNVMFHIKIDFIPNFIWYFYLTFVVRYLSIEFDGFTTYQNIIVVLIVKEWSHHL